MRACALHPIMSMFCCIAALTRRVGANLNAMLMFTWVYSEDTGSSMHQQQQQTFPPAQLQCTAHQPCVRPVSFTSHAVNRVIDFFLLFVVYSGELHWISSVEFLAKLPMKVSVCFLEFPSESSLSSSFSSSV